MADGFIWNNLELLTGIRRASNSMNHKDTAMDGAVKQWAQGIRFSKPEVCLEATKALHKAAIAKRDQLLKMEVDDILTSEEVKLLGDLVDLDLDSIR